MLVKTITMSAALGMMFVKASEHLLFLQCLEDLVRCDGDVEVRDTEWRERIHDGVCDRRGRTHGGGFSHALGTYWVVR